MIKGLVFLLILNMVAMTAVWWQVYHLRNEVAQTIKGAQDMLVMVENLQIPEKQSRLLKSGIEGLKKGYATWKSHDR